MISLIPIPFELPSSPLCLIESDLVTYAFLELIDLGCSCFEKFYPVRDIYEAVIFVI